MNRAGVRGGGGADTGSDPDPVGPGLEVGGLVEKVPVLSLGAGT